MEIEGPCDGMWGHRCPEVAGVGREYAGEVGEGRRGEGESPRRPKRVTPLDLALKAALPRALGPQEVPTQPAPSLPELLLTSPIPSLPRDLEGS